MILSLENNTKLKKKKHGNKGKKAAITGYETILKFKFNRFGLLSDMTQTCQAVNLSMKIVQLLIDLVNMAQ